MSGRWLRAAAVPAAAALLIAGCGSKPASAPQRPAAVPPPPQLNAATTTAAGTSWAIVVMGGSTAQNEDFWQLFARPAGAVKWRQVTPTGVADNGGLVAGVTGPGSLVAGFRPSQDLSFSPLAATADSGASWSTAGPVNPGLANVPDALAAGPGGQLIALTQGGAQLGTHGGAAWTTLASARSLAATAAGRACGLTKLTAAAFGSPGAAAAPLLAGSCDHPGIAGIFVLRGGTWRSAGPPLPAPLTGRTVTVLRMATVAGRTDALLQSGTGATADVLAAWSDDGGGHWLTSAPLPTGTATVRSASFGPDGAVGVVLGRDQSHGHGAVLARSGAPWRTLPALPSWTATLAVGPAGRLDALTAHASSFGDWQLPAGAAAWRRVQTSQVTIPYGSSG
jgi:hypothetical protein